MPDARPIPTNPDPALTLPQAAEYLGLSPRSLRLLSEQGRIVVTRYGPANRLVRYRVSDLEVYLDSCRVQDRPR